MTTAAISKHRHWLTAPTLAAVIAAALALAPAVAQAGNGCITHSSTADGTAAHPFLIENSGNLQCIRDNPDVYWESQHFKQTADIDLSALPAWTSTIGTSAVDFTGSYDGNGKKITGLRVELTGSNAGLFGVTSAASISNLTLDNAAVSIPDIRQHNVGAIVGLASDSTVITNVHSSGTVNGRTAGGIVGVIHGGTQLSSSSSSAVITGAFIGAGGLVGGAFNSSITDSSASGSVIGDWLVGGLVGFVGGSTITRSYAAGDVTGRPARPGYDGYIGTVGGLVGQLGFPSVDGESVIGESVIGESFATGDVTAIDPVVPAQPDLCGACAGGLVGLAYETDAGTKVEISNSYASGAVTGGVSAGGLVGTNQGASADSTKLVILTSYSRSAVAGPEAATGGILGAFPTGGFTWGSALWNPTDAASAHLNSWGTEATQTQMKTFAFYSNADPTWNISDTSPTTKKWVSCAAHNDGYPFLQWYAAKQNWSCSPAPSNLFTVRLDGASTTAVSSLITVPGAGKASQTGTFSASSSAHSAKTVTACRDSKKISKAGRYRLSCKLTAATRAARRNHSIRLTLRTTFTPTGGSARTVTRTVTLRKTSSGVTG